MTGVEASGTRVFVLFDVGQVELLVLGSPVGAVKELLSVEDLVVVQFALEVAGELVHVDAEEVAILHGEDGCLAEGVEALFLGLGSSGEAHLLLVEVDELALVLEEGGHVAVVVKDKSELAIVASNFALRY